MASLKSQLSVDKGPAMHADFPAGNPALAWGSVEISNSQHVRCRRMATIVAQVGQRIQFCGFARINRGDGEAGAIDTTVLPLTALVENSSNKHFSVSIERYQYRWSGECLLKRHQSFLGGMSGGPALLLNDPTFPLVGMVCEGNEAFDLVYFRPLSLVPWAALVA